ncbi:hypothetical protein NUU61_002984 [Penicillium alfredii]|uniref:Alpha/beta hydrolase fold-3 domain-containing protein n=1 Tax=Penicillium alfredii TaxID=1506179 RepID=A0A9W9FTK5_9EURO|nr:uncharacterized protein NUU61_002984 [Penicillium alfredii]KAJ5105637.1 hypothetical protein NUU61_002984 [Penicillium alfredii]
MNLEMRSSKIEDGEDGVDAILWLWEHGEQYGLDRTRFVLSGGSAGGNLACAVPFRLHEYFRQRQQGQHEQHEPEQKRNNRIGLAGIVGFYPSTDWTRTRKERDATNPIAAKKSIITPKVFSFFDNSYLLPETLPKQSGTNTVDMSHPYLSPGLAPTAQLLAAYPLSVVLYTCAWDQLLVEGNAFRERLHA